jgi:hypothetical protein
VHAPEVPSRKLLQMSDRSGVGAPTHDGADSDPSGPAASDTADRGASDARDDTASPSGAAGAVAKVRRRLGRDLFGTALGAEPAASVPPGVPATASVDVTDDEPELDVSDDVASARTEPAPRRRALTTRAAVVTEPDAAAIVDPEPQIIDSSMDSGVVPVVAEETRPRGRRGGLRARRVHRIVRRVDPWSVLKLSLIFYFCVWLMVVVSGVLIWGVAVGSGTVEGLEGFIERLLGFEEFQFNADQIFRLFAMGGLILVFLATAVTAILTVLFNLISDLIGGIRFTVIEEESTRRIVSED